MNNKKYIKEQKYNLSIQRGKTGAARKLANLILDSIKRVS